MGPPCLMPWQPDRKWGKKESSPRVEGVGEGGYSACVCGVGWGFHRLGSQWDCSLHSLTHGDSDGNEEGRSAFEIHDRTENGICCETNAV